MGEIIDKAKGAANKAIGKGKSAVGRRTGNTELGADGDKQQLKGKAQKAFGTIKGAMGNKL